MEISQPKAHATSNPDPSITPGAPQSPLLSLSINIAIQKNKFHKLQINSGTNRFLLILILFQSSMGIMLHDLPKIHLVSYAQVL